MKNYTKYRTEPYCFHPQTNIFFISDSEYRYRYGTLPPDTDFAGYPAILFIYSKLILAKNTFLHFNEFKQIPTLFFVISNCKQLHITAYWPDIRPPEYWM